MNTRGKFLTECEKRCREVVSVYEQILHSLTDAYPMCIFTMVCLILTAWFLDVYKTWH